MKYSIKKNKLISIVLLFLVVFQIGFSSVSFAFEKNMEKNTYDYKYKEYTLDDLVNCKSCDKMTKEEIIIFLKLLNDPEVRELHNKLIKNCTGSDRVSRMQWYQIPDLMGGFWDGFYDELEGTIEGIKSMFRWDTYKAMLEFCGAIGNGDITLNDLGEMALSQLEPIEYVIDNSSYVMDPWSDVSDDEVREYGANLCKTIIIIIDAKNTLKELPSCLKKFEGLLDDFGGVTGNVIKNKKPDVKIDIDDFENVVSEDGFKIDLQLFSEGFISLSKKDKKHVLNRHSFDRVKTQLSHQIGKVSRDILENDIAERNFFNPDWSEDMIADAVERGYNKLLKEGIRNDRNEIDVDGEWLLIVMEDGKFITAWGTHKFELSDFGF